MACREGVVQGRMCIGLGFAVLQNSHHICKLYKKLCLINNLCRISNFCKCLSVRHFLFAAKRANGLFKSEHMERTATHVSRFLAWTLAGASAVAVSET